MNAFMYFFSHICVIPSIKYCSTAINDPIDKPLSMRFKTYLGKSLCGEIQYLYDTEFLCREHFYDEFINELI